MLYQQTIGPQSALRQQLTKMYRCSEVKALAPLIAAASMPESVINKIQVRAKTLVESIRKKRIGKSSLDAFMYQYHLSSEEGIALMCLAEALLRIPDKTTQDKLIKDKIAEADWAEHSGKSSSMFVNAATWGLMLTGRIYQWDELPAKNLLSSLKKLTKRSGEPMIRQAVNYAMKILGKQFVMGRNIEEALKRAEELEEQGYRYSYDMLGEAARTAEDAERYYQAYQKAILAIGKKMQHQDHINSAGISIKLSALHPRYEFAKYDDVMQKLVSKLLELSIMAREQNIGLTVDAEEADRLDLSLDVFKAVFVDKALAGWSGLGLAVQAYQKRAYDLIDWLADLARAENKSIMIRLVKGAYWDSEIKLSQELGLEGYPVFTRKVATDVSYLACAKKIIEYGDTFYPQFATHNAYSVSAIMEMMGKRKDFEFQCLHGMGQPLYDEVVGKNNWDIPCRIYAPVGTHEDLLAYLVRRLLENGANSSFVNRIADAKEPIEKLIEDPITVLNSYSSKAHPKIPLPRDIYGAERLNSKGIDLTNFNVLAELKHALDSDAKIQYKAGSIISGQLQINAPQPVKSPSDCSLTVGSASAATQEDVRKAMDAAKSAFESWNQTAVNVRAACLLKAADLLEENMAKFMAIAIREAGKTIPDAVAEVREAIDFCRYYAAQAVEHMSKAQELTGPTGELNQLSLHGRGVIVCISPWNFPLAIFIGQVTAALVTGNTVLAKPAEQTPIIATEAVKLLHEAGIPVDVLHLLLGSGDVVGAALVQDLATAGVMFTGSTQTARLINQTLANKSGAIIPLIAETGGQNAMIVDSSALPEQVVKDVSHSAFGSAGQRCSALRVLYLQEDVADKIITMLTGAMAELVVADPAYLSTDVGPVIDKDAQSMLQAHFDKMQAEAKLLYQVKLGEHCNKGMFFAPCAFEISSINCLEQENFGPFLHVVRYKSKDLDKVISDINNAGYGLTLGIHSRIESTIQKIIENVRVGNMYVNRSMTGAVVGVQPFGGERLSGTGPKAGGPHYLFRLCAEQSLSVNTTASGGNASLMSLDD